MGEAEGEPYAGKIMVAEVIINRARAGKQSLKAVCLAENQFTCWNGKHGEKLLNRLPALEKQTKNQGWKDCKRIAENVCRQDYKPSTSATHYYAPAGLKNPPKWADKMKLVAIVAGHKFFCE
jgi:hypothetical protein